jgi:hypothetical protein
VAALALSASGHGRLPNQSAHVAPAGGPRLKKTQRKEDPETPEEDVFSISLKKTQPKKTPFSDRRIYRTIGTALTVVVLVLQRYEGFH